MGKNYWLILKKIIILLIFSLLFVIFSQTAQAATLTVCPEGCQYSGVAGIQSAVEAAKDNDIVFIENGNYRSTNPVVTTPNNCLVSISNKKITLKSNNALLDNGNGNLDKQDNFWSSGICIYDSEVTLDSIKIKQTLKPAIVVRNSKVIIKNVTFIDIDHLAVEMRLSQVYIINSLLAGSVGVFVGDYSYLRFENNTVYGGQINFNLCNNNQPSGEVINNILIRGLIKAQCPEEEQKLANIKVENNFVYHGNPHSDPFCAEPGNTEGESCATTQNELCNGVTFAWPEIVGDGEKGTICVWGEGFIQGDFSPKPNSITALAGAGASYGPCAKADSTECFNHIQSHPFPQNINPQNPQNPPPLPPPVNNPPPNQNNSNLPPININQLRSLFPGKEKTNSFNLFVYVILSLIYIMVIHFAVNMGSEFNLMQMTLFFIFSGVLGYLFLGYEAAFVVGVVLSLIFIGGPRKDL